MVVSPHMKLLSILSTSGPRKKDNPVNEWLGALDQTWKPVAQGQRHGGKKRQNATYCRAIPKQNAGKRGGKPWKLLDKLPENDSLSHVYI